MPSLSFSSYVSSMCSSLYLSTLIGVAMAAGATEETAATAAKREKTHDLANIGFENSAVAVTGVDLIALLGVEYVYLEDLESAAKLSEEREIGNAPFYARCAIATLNLVDFILQIIIRYNGYGPPETGYEFRDGRQDFSGKIRHLLEDARPHDGWSGAAAERYEEKNTQQLMRFASMATADESVASALADQASDVRQVRQYFAEITLSLSGALALALVLYQQCLSCYYQGLIEISEVWCTRLWCFVAGVVVMALAAILVELKRLETEVAQRAKKALDEVIQTYRSVVESAQAEVSANRAARKDITMFRTPISQVPHAATFTNFNRAPVNESTRTVLVGARQNHGVGLAPIIFSGDTPTAPLPAAGAQAVAVKQSGDNLGIHPRYLSSAAPGSKRAAQPGAQPQQQATPLAQTSPINEACIGVQDERHRTDWWAVPAGGLPGLTVPVDVHSDQQISGSG